MENSRSTPVSTSVSGGHSVENDHLLIPSLLAAPFADPTKANFDFDSMPGDLSEKEAYLRNLAKDLSLYAQMLRRKARELEQRERDLDIGDGAFNLVRTTSLKNK